jgi:hypothetical protein
LPAVAADMLPHHMESPATPLRVGLICEHILTPSSRSSACRAGKG